MISPGQKNSTKLLPEFIQAIDDLFVKLELTYHYQFYKVFGDDDKLLTGKKIWAKNLKKFNPSIIVKATDWLISNTEHINVNHSFYFIGSDPVIDYIVKFETLDLDLLKLADVRPDLSSLASSMRGSRYNKNPINHRLSTAELFQQDPLAADLARQCCRLQFQFFAYSTDPSHAL